ncbi:Methylsterol monooxygenase [Bertholletia excelsa]
MLRLTNNYSPVLTALSLLLVLLLSCDSGDWRVYFTTLFLVVYPLSLSLSLSLCINLYISLSLHCTRRSSSDSAFMASIIESGWLYLITHFNDFQLACLGSFLIHESVFFLSGLPFIFFERAGWLSKYKIQAKNNSPQAQEKCITRLLLYHFCVNLPVMLVSYPVFRIMGMRSSLPLPSWKVISTQILFYFILEDFVFYWGHRVLHTKWLYKHVHSIHHEYATPFGLTSEYAHPAEILFLGFATIVGPAITGPHLITLWLWMVLRVLETVEAHCGYHFPWSPSNFLPLYGGSDFHDYHHRLLYTKSGNYSSTFVYMDWIFGTDRGYRKLKALNRDEDVADEKQI